MRMYEDGDEREWVLYGNTVVDAEVWELSQGDRLDVMVSSDRPLFFCKLFASLLLSRRYDDDFIASARRPINCMAAQK